MISPGAPRGAYGSLAILRSPCGRKIQTNLIRCGEPAPTKAQFALSEEAVVRQYYGVAFKMIHKAARRRRCRRTPHATSRSRPQNRSGADWTHCLKLLRVAETRNEAQGESGDEANAVSA